MEGTVFTPSLEGMKSIKSEQGEILTKPFLQVCKHILPVIDKFGAAMSIVKSDVGGNISRLESKYSSNSSEFNFLYSIIRAEVEAKTAKASSSCTNSLLWLTRAMDFLVELFRNLLEQPDRTMSQVCTDSYNKTLKKWHGWLASSSFTVALKLAPDRKKFVEVLGGTGDLKADMEIFCANFSPLLEENHKFLLSIGSASSSGVGLGFCTIPKEVLSQLSGLQPPIRVPSTLQVLYTAFTSPSDSIQILNQVPLTFDQKRLALAWTISKLLEDRVLFSRDSLSFSLCLSSVLFLFPVLH